MGDFELDAVLYFMISKGGRVRNHELVTHFKNFLNHPINKAENREKFKDYVNELATIKIDAGEKVLVLKKKYRPPSDADSFGSSTASLPTVTPAKSSGSSSWKPNASQPNLTDSHSSATPASSIKDSRSAKNDSPRAQSEPPAAQSKGNDSDDMIDGGMASKVKSDENMEVKMRHTDRVAAVPPSAPQKHEDSVSISNSVTGSNASLASTGSGRSLASSTSGVASMEDDGNSSVISVKERAKKLNKIHSETDLNQPRQPGYGTGNKKNHKHTRERDDDDDSYITLDAEQKDWMVVCSTSEYHDMNRLLSKNPALAKLKDFTNGYTALHWAAKSGKAEVIKLIANKQGVNVDQRSHGGYTALHLAAIHGHEHIIELLVQTFKADANLRDYTGKKAKQYLKNSASSKAQQLLVSRRLGSDLHTVKTLDDSFIRSASMRMSNRAKAMSSLLQVKSAVARQPLLRSSWGGSTEDLYDDKDKSTRTPPGSTGSSPSSSRRKRDMDLMPPPSNAMMNRRNRHPDRSKSSSRESLNSPQMSRKNDENQNMMRSGSDPGLLEKKHTVV